MSYEGESRKFHETKNLKLRDEIYRLSRELIKLDERGCLCRDETGWRALSFCIIKYCV